MLSLAPSAFRICSINRLPSIAAWPASRRWPPPHYLLGEIHVYSVNARTPAKGSGQQPLHSDVPRAHAKDWRMINTMVMLDDMTEDNGATRIVPGSHKWSPINVPDVNMAEVKALELDR
jgi:ectoine hydroxylase-related dioxygenase (phytanoyl-CoA dioxygenase family)